MATADDGVATWAVVGAPFDPGYYAPGSATLFSLPALATEARWETSSPFDVLGSAVGVLAHPDGVVPMVAVGAFMGDGAVYVLDRPEGP